MDHSADNSETPQPREIGATAKESGQGNYLKLTVFLAAVVAAGVLYYFFGQSLTLQSLAEKEATLRGWKEQQPVVVYAAAFALYVLVTGLSLPGAAILTLVYGWYFQFVAGVILVSFASTTGATVAFLLSRFLLRDWIQARFGERLRTFNENLEKEGAFYLFTLRLIAGVPFFVVNLVMGPTPIKARTFWWVSQLGMLPGTIVYVYAGSVVPNLQTLADKGIQAVFTPSQLIQIAVALSLLGLMPLAVRFAMKWFGKREAYEDAAVDFRPDDN